MENASKALIIAASVMIAVMLLAIMTYALRKASILPEAQETRDEELVITSFNNQFQTYLTESQYDFGDFGSTNSYTNRNDENTKNRYNASKGLNNISDVVTAINLAVHINDTNNYSYKLDYLETVNTVEVIIDFGEDYRNVIPEIITSRYYGIEPNKNVKPNTVYSMNSISNKNDNIRNFNTSNALSTYKLLENLRDSKLVLHSHDKYTLYKYYFSGSFKFNNTTGKIDSVTFKLIKDKGFDLLTYTEN